MEKWKEKYEALEQNFQRFKNDYEEFIQIAAHDLDSPLRKLLTFVDRLSEKYRELPDEDAQLYIRRIHSLAELMRSIVDSLHHLSIVQTERLPMQNCDLNELVNKILANFNEEINEKHATIDVAKLPVIKGNANQLMLLFKNIFDNSLKFSREDVAPHISVSTEMLSQSERVNLRLGEDAGYHKISISDNGIGFRQEQSDDIFKPFVRLHGKSEYPGSGLGLSICKKIVEKHNGFMWAESSENSGARFVLILAQ